MPVSWSEEERENERREREGERRVTNDAICPYISRSINCRICQMPFGRARGRERKERGEERERERETSTD